MGNNIVSNFKVFGLEDSIKASKYPMSVDIDSLNSEITPTFRKLCKADVGSGHDQALTGIIVQFDLTFSIKAWTEAERYHFLDFVSSQSTMHRILKFNLVDQCNKYVDRRIIDIIQNKINEYNRLSSLKDYNSNREELLKELYLEILYNIPVGFKLTARMTTNYRQLKTIYYQRKNHRLPEWRSFCSWIEELPCFTELILNEV